MKKITTLAAIIPSAIMLGLYIKHFNEFEEWHAHLLFGGITIASFIGSCIWTYGQLTGWKKKSK